MKRVAFGGFYANLYYDLAHQYFESILNVIFVPPRSGRFDPPSNALAVT